MARRCGNFSPARGKTLSKQRLVRFGKTAARQGNENAILQHHMPPLRLRERAQRFLAARNLRRRHHLGRSRVQYDPHPRGQIPVCLMLAVEAGKRPFDVIFRGAPLAKERKKHFLLVQDVQRQLAPDEVGQGGDFLAVETGCVGQAIERVAHLPVLKMLEQDELKRILRLRRSQIPLPDRHDWPPRVDPGACANPSELGIADYQSHCRRD